MITKYQTEPLGMPLRGSVSVSKSFNSNIYPTVFLKPYIAQGASESVLKGVLDEAFYQLELVTTELTKELLSSREEVKKLKQELLVLKKENL